MRGRWPGALAAGLAAAALLVAPSQAGAKPGYFVFPKYHETALAVGGTHGFTISISRSSGWVTLHASSDEGAAVYLVRPRRSSRNGIRARFPGVGRIAVRFHPSGPPVRTKAPFFPGCRGGGEIEQPGTFTGTIRFRGERDFTRVAARRARGLVQHSFREVCKGPTGHEKPDGFSGYLLEALKRSPGRLVSFSATRFSIFGELDDEVHFLANTAERRASMRIARIASVTAGTESFVVADPTARSTSASVAPPAPFGGTAEFRLAPDGRPELDGTLSVDLPGAPAVELAGPSFSPQLCIDRRCTGG
jgi:hypothetical protein